MAIEDITDEKILELRSLPKEVKNPGAKRRQVEKYERLDYEIVSTDGANQFRVYLRQNLTDNEDFSCGIRWLMPSGDTLTLARYNGSSHVHDDIRHQCHIHGATEDEIRKGRKPERRAEATERYNTVEGALDALVVDFQISGLETGSVYQTELFNGT